jgi:glucan-binding YG repeat protein
MTEQIIPVEAQRTVEQTEIMVKTFDNYIVSTQDTYAKAGEDLLEIKSKIKELDELRKSLTKPLDESKKRIMDFFKKPLDVLENARVAVDNAARGWWNEQERLRQAEERRLAEIQRKADEELERQARETEEKASKLKTAKAQEAAKVKAQELREKATATEAIAPVVESKVEAVSGMTMRDNWKFRILDVNLIPREFMIPDEKLINRLASATRGQQKIAGVEFYNEKTIVSRR